FTCAQHLLSTRTEHTSFSMRWCRRGAHLLLQVRTRVLDDTLTTTFQRWYPGTNINDSLPEPAQVVSQAHSLCRCRSRQLARGGTS
ncbi:MAG TPA: hypothetical protein VFV38_47065, partial [Ktedonobacteraceae bacterium]|nr:hypothetical protein [Ktedonobacteraceae bacterium]